MRRRKRSASVTLLAALGTLSACDDAPKERDVYLGANAVGDCIEDWGSKGLCDKRLTQEDANRIAHSSGGSHPVYIYNSGWGVYGPSYSPGARVVTSGSRTYAPTASRAVNVAQFSGTRLTTFTSAAKPTSVPSVPLMSRSGFGATGRGISTGGAS